MKFRSLKESEKLKIPSSPFSIRNQLTSPLADTSPLPYPTPPLSPALSPLSPSLPLQNPIPSVRPQPVSRQIGELRTREGDVVAAGCIWYLAAGKGDGKRRSGGGFFGWIDLGKEGLEILCYPPLSPPSPSSGNHIPLPHVYPIPALNRYLSPPPSPLHFPKTPSDPAPSPPLPHLSLSQGIS